MYINEIIRITYKCNWKCRFCNVLKVNNFGENDISHKEIIYKILYLTRKYSFQERKKLVLSFSGGEPLLNPNICHYISLAKKIGVGLVQIQTNGSIIFKNKKLFYEIIKAGLDEIFLAQHSHIDIINKKLGCFYKFSDFINWFNFLLENKIYINIRLNIVITKINLMYTLDFIEKLKEIGFLKYIGNKISFGFCQPNGYAMLNKKEVLLDFKGIQKKKIDDIIFFCKKYNIDLDFHYTAPPLCILNYPEYNLEYEKLKKLEKDKHEKKIIQSSLIALHILKKEKIKLQKCKSCKYDKYCFGFYKNWIDFIGVEYLNQNISYLKKDEL